MYSSARIRLSAPNSGNSNSRKRHNTRLRTDRAFRSWRTASEIWSLAIQNTSNASSNIGSATNATRRDGVTPLDEFLRESWRVATTVYIARNNKFHRRLYGNEARARAFCTRFVNSNRNLWFCRVVNVNSVTTKARYYPRPFLPLPACLAFLLLRCRYMSATWPFFSRKKK